MLELMLDSTNLPDRPVFEDSPPNDIFLQTHARQKAVHTICEGTICEGQYREGQYTQRRDGDSTDTRSTEGNLGVTSYSRLAVTSNI
jgi:hypothetical protein